MQPIISTPTNNSQDLGEFSELYQLHVQYFRAAQDSIRQEVRPGREQDAQLAFCEPMTREYFELKMEALQNDPIRYGHIVQELRQGFAA